MVASLLLGLLVVVPDKVGAWGGEEIDCVEVVRRVWAVDQRRELPEFTELDKGLRRSVGDGCVMEMKQGRQTSTLKFSYWGTENGARKVFDELKSGEEDEFEIIDDEGEG